MKLTKTNICCTCLFLTILSCVNKQSKTNDNTNHLNVKKEYNNIIFKTKINNIVIYSENIEIETPFNIQRDNFLNTFDDIDSVSIIEPKGIDDFINELKKVNLSNNNNSSTIDTRYLVKINYENGTTEILYGDRFNIIFRNMKFRPSPSMISKIYSYSNKLSDKNH